MNQNSYRKLISGENDSLQNRLLRSLLRILSGPYASAIRFRNSRYDSGFFRKYRVPAKVISVGNITAGGTGKTPIVVWLCNMLIKQGHKVSVLTRGYKTDSQKLSDEPALLQAECPGLNIIVNSDRVAGARIAIRQHGADVLVMDDGFQHRRLARNLDIIAIDATCPFGYGDMLPAGLLREPLESLKRAQACIITRSDLATPEQVARIRSQIFQINPDMTIAHATHAPDQAILPKNPPINLNDLKNYKIAAFCGIGNPEAFFSQLRKIDLNIVTSRSYNDHHTYKVGDVTDISEQAHYLGCNLILCTHKDWVKIESLLKDNPEIPFAYLAMKLDFTAGEDIISGIIQNALNAQNRAAL